ncbi:uncharacterized protein LOC128203748 isoform X2 [Mya arenaria]|uniref:uncharacterized protein LOC128203748 isoform X2 n=1 Tax=Mya arenaria TaxID=6604 RepID=UPI0022E69B94|nr:uncharacterized protein LOC128203748 isoform X2 [Mya arenaria]
MIHRIYYIFVISFMIWASCLLLKSTDGSPPQLHVCNLANESANACCSACAYNQQPGDDLGCNRSCPADYHAIVDNNNSCNRIGEQSTSTAIPTTTTTEDPNFNETDTSNATNHTIASLKVPYSHYCIRNCASREYFDEQRLKCQLCPTHCLECSDKDNCTTCYVEHDNDCHQECPQGFYQSTKNSAGSIICKGSEIESKSKLGFIIGVTVGGVVLVVLVVIVILIVMVKRKKWITGKTHWDSQDGNAKVSDTLALNADADSSTTKAMDSGHKNAGLEDYDLVTFDTKHRKEKTDPAKTKLDADSSATKAMNSGHKTAGLEDYDLVTFDHKQRQDKSDPAQTKLDAGSSKTKAMNSGHTNAGLEDYDLVTFDTKHRNDKTDPAQTKLDQHTEPGEERTRSREHKVEDYMTVTIPPSEKTKPDNEKPEIKQEDADGDDSTNPPPTPQRLEKAKTDVKEKAENVHDEIGIIPTSLRRTNKIVVDG